VLGGLAKPQKGTVRIFGRKLESIPRLKLYQMLGIVFQNPSDQLFAATVGEDVAFGPRNLGLDPDTVDRRVSEALEALNRPGTFASALSTILASVSRSVLQ